MLYTPVSELTLYKFVYVYSLKSYQDMNVTELVEDFMAPECVDVDTPEKGNPALPNVHEEPANINVDPTHITLRKKNIFKPRSYKLKKMGNRSLDDILEEVFIFICVFPVK